MARRLSALAQHLFPQPTAGGFYDLKDTDIDGKPFDFAQLKGRVVYAVNTASKWGMTKANYANFQKFSKMDGVSLLLIPSGQFGGQELPTDAEIKAFLVESGLNLPNVHMLSKGDVRTQPLKLPGKPADGPAGNPRASWVAMQTEAGANEPGWNFGTHFLISKSGKISTAKPKEVEAGLQALLKE